MTSPAGLLAIQKDAMQRAIAGTDEATNGCNNIHTRVAEQMAVLAQHYSGESATAFQNVMHEWDNDFRRILQAVRFLHDNLVANLQGLGAMEQHNVDIATRRG